METFQTPEQRDRGRGSFSGTVEATQRLGIRDLFSPSVVGKAKFTHSGSRRETTVDNIFNSHENSIKGVGPAMFQAIETRAKARGATSLSTDLTAQGDATKFYRSMGMHPDPAQVAEWQKAVPSMPMDTIASKVASWKKSLVPPVAPSSSASASVSSPAPRSILIAPPLTPPLTRERSASFTPTGILSGPAPSSFDDMMRSHSASGHSHGAPDWLPPASGGPVKIFDIRRSSGNK